MPIGVGAAMLIGSAVAGGTAVASAKLQSNAAKNAAKEQQKGTDRALQVQQQANAPYLALGQQGAQRLAQTPFQPYTQQFQPGRPNNGFQAPQGPPPTLGSIGQPQGAPGMGQPQMVTLQAPDGSTRQFPAMDAQRVMQQAKMAGHELRQV